MTAEKGGIEGSGFNYRDKVIVNHIAREATAIIESIHAGGKKVDVRIDFPGHPEHGRVVTFSTSEVRADDRDE